MNTRQIERRIKELLKKREVFIIQQNYWEANKLGETIRGLRNQLDLSDLDRATLSMNARFTREYKHA